eukprot:scaffold7651_cov363-Prasinococcus_capsulatus_cf.AAC.1
MRHYTVRVRVFEARNLPFAPPGTHFQFHGTLSRQQRRSSICTERPVWGAQPPGTAPSSYEGEEVSWQVSDAQLRKMQKRGSILKLSLLRQLAGSAGDAPGNPQPHGWAVLDLRGNARGILGPLLDSSAPGRVDVRGEAHHLRSGRLSQQCLARTAANGHGCAGAKLQGAMRRGGGEWVPLQGLGRPGGRQPEVRVRTTIDEASRALRREPGVDLADSDEAFNPSSALEAPPLRKTAAAS